MGAGTKEVPSIEALPDKVLLRVFSFLKHQEMMKYSVVSKKWRMIAQDSRLWGFVSLRPEISGLQIQSVDMLLKLIQNRFAANLRYLELPCDLITREVLQELANRCPNLTHLLLDFSHGAQLADFSELNAFPTKIKYLCLCLSETIFLDNFMKKIYNFINGIELLHLYGTYEQGEEEEGEVYEVLNIRTLKQATPNLRVINMYGISFVDDTHIEAFSSNCIQLAVLCVNYCSKVQGTTLKILVQRCKYLRCLMLQQTNLTAENMTSVEWEKATALQELDITATDLNQATIIDILTRVPALQWLSAGQLDGMNDMVLTQWMNSGKCATLRALDLDSSDNVTEDMLGKFLERFGGQLEGLALSGMGHVTDTLWNAYLPKLVNARILVMGTAEAITTKIHVDHMIDSLAKFCPKLERLEFRWDNDTLRFSDKNQKAIDLLRTKCLSLKSMVLCDGKLYEIMRGNFERADRRSVIRTTVNSKVTIHYLLANYEEPLEGRNTQGVEESPAATLGSST